MIDEIFSNIIKLDISEINFELCEKFICFIHEGIKYIMDYDACGNVCIYSKQSSIKIYISPENLSYINYTKNNINILKRYDNEIYNFTKININKKQKKLYITKYNKIYGMKKQLYYDEVINIYKRFYIDNKNNLLRFSKTIKTYNPMQLLLLKHLQTIQYHNYKFYIYRYINYKSYIIYYKNYNYKYKYILFTNNYLIFKLI